MRNGKQYLESLDDGRRVYVNGEKVSNPTEHPAFSGAIRTAASLYDAALDPSNDMIFTDPETGIEANKVFMIPRSYEDLEQRRQAIISWASITKGLMGRSPTTLVASSPDSPVPRRCSRKEILRSPTTSSASTRR